MAGGQAMDLAATGLPLALAELERLHAHKTGALIGASVKLGVLAAQNVADQVRDAIERYATCLGLAFQIRDDVLDVSGSSETLGKTQGKDAAQEKTTYATLLGLAGAQRKAESLRQEALTALSDLGPDADPLRQLADYIVNRVS
jgi:farnesyl diphosphate synthase